MPRTGRYGTAVFEAWRTISKRDFHFLSDGAVPDLDPWANYNLPIIGIDALAAGARSAGALGSCRIELPARNEGDRNQFS